MSEELKNKIIGAIQKGEVTMRPRWHFVLRSTLLVLGIVISILALLFLASLVMFLLRANGVFFVPLFGLHGLRSFFFALPWLLIFATLLFIIVLEVLTHFYRIGRRTPLLYSALGILIFVLCATALIAKTAFHDRIILRTVDGNLPFVGGMYRGFSPPEDIHRGRISNLVEGGFILVYRRGGTSTVTITPATRLPYGANFADQDVVVVFGEKNEQSIVAEGILQVSEEGFDPIMIHTDGAKRLFRMHPIDSGEERFTAPLTK